jgi:hypothetical protein
MLFSECLPADNQCVAAEPLWHDEGDLIGMVLEPHHLPLARFDGNTIVVVPFTSFVAVRLTVILAGIATAQETTLKRQTKAVVRKFFHPRYCALKQLTSDRAGLRRSELKTALEAIPGVAAVELAWQADADRLYMENAQTVGLYVSSGEVVNWQVEKIAVHTA